MSEGKKKLLELEKTGKYFFHGSPNEVEVFEPRQSHNDVKGVQIPDGDPAVSASPAIDYAIFMAIFSRKNFPKNYTTKTSTNAESEFAEKFKLTFFATQATLDQLTDDASGWVYVFNKEDFPFRKSPSEFRSRVPVRPIEKILVTKEDLPSPISILTEW